MVCVWVGVCVGVDVYVVCVGRCICGGCVYVLT